MEPTLEPEQLAEKAIDPAIDPIQLDRDRTLRSEVFKSLRPCNKASLETLRTITAGAAESLFRTLPLAPVDHLTDPLDDPQANLSRAEKEVLARERLRDSWRKVFEEDETTLEEAAPRLPIVGWRLASAIAHARGLLNSNETLADLPINPSYDWWRDPTTYPPPVQMPINTLARAISTLADPRPDSRQKRLAIAPPDPPYTTEGKIPNGYDPDNDEALGRWCELHSLAADHLGLRRTALDAVAVEAIVTPWSARIAFPSREEVLLVEERLIAEAGRGLVEEGVARTVETLRTRRGLTEQEAQALVKGARRLVVQLAQADGEEYRALVTLRLEDAARRARDRGDLRNELDALKQLTVVQGLSKVEPEDALKDFVGLVGRKTGTGRTLPAHALPQNAQGEGASSEAAQLPPPSQRTLGEPTAPRSAREERAAEVFESIQDDETTFEENFTPQRSTSRIRVSRP